MTWLYRWLSISPLFFPLYLVRFEVAGIPTTLLEVLIAVTALWWMVDRMRGFSLGRFLLMMKQQGLRNPLYPVGLFAVAATLSLLIVPDTIVDITGETLYAARSAQGIWKGWIVAPLIYFFMLWSTPKTFEFWRSNLMALTFSGVGLSFFALQQMISGDYMTLDGRASGLFESANYLALYLGPVLLGTVLFALEEWRENSRLQKLFFIVASLLMALAFWGTRSYAAFLAMGAGFLFYAFTHPGISSRRKGRACVLALFVSGIFLVSQMNTLKFQQFLDFGGRTSSSIRIEVYTIAGKLIQAHPILGVGLGQFGTEYRLNAHEILGHTPYEWVMIHPHNLFLALWLNTGFLGLIGMGWLLILVFWNRVANFPSLLQLFRQGVCSFLRKVKGYFDQKMCSNESFSRIAKAMLVMTLVHGLFDTPFFKNDLAYLWWLMVAMGL